MKRSLSMTVPHRSRGLLLASIAYLGVVTFWVGPEDSIWAAAALGAVGALLGALNVITLRLGGQSLHPARWMLLMSMGGGLAGLAAGGVTVLLMLVKTAVHAHGEFTDYPAHVVLGVLRRAPLWGAAGLLAGAALGMASLTRSKINPKSE